MNKSILVLARIALVWGFVTCLSSVVWLGWSLGLVSAQGSAFLGMSVVGLVTDAVELGLLGFLWFRAPALVDALVGPGRLEFRATPGFRRLLGWVLVLWSLAGVVQVNVKTETFGSSTETTMVKESSLATTWATSFNVSALLSLGLGIGLLATARRHKIDEGSDAVV